MLAFLNTTEPDADKELILALYESHKSTMAAIIYKVTGDKNLIDDLLQESILRLIPHIGTLRRLEPYQRRRYTLLTTKSTAIDYMRQNAKQRGWVYYSEEVPGEASREEGPEARFISLEERGELHRSIGELSERDHDLICYKYFLGFSDAELSHTLGISPRNIREYLSRARRRLRKLMLGRWSDE